MVDSSTVSVDFRSWKGGALTLRTFPPGLPEEQGRGTGKGDGDGEIVTSFRRFPVLEGGRGGSADISAWNLQGAG